MQAIQTPQFKHLEKWVHPQYYMGENYPEYYIVYSRNRDSDILEESNFHSITEELKDHEGFISPSFNHWLCGWCEIIMMHESDHEGLIKADQLLENLSDYPILDDEDYSERELDSRIESWENWARSDFIHGIEGKLDLELSDNQDDNIKEFFDNFTDRINEYWIIEGSGSYIDMDRIIEKVQKEDLVKHGIKFNDEGED
jgi:hypothetical protein